MPSEKICSHFSQEGQINLFFSPDSCICIAFSIDIHNSYRAIYGSVRQPIWVSFKKALKMQQSGENLKLIGPSSEK